MENFKIAPSGIFSGLFVDACVYFVYWVGGGEFVRGPDLGCVSEIADFLGVMVGSSASFFCCMNLHF